MTDKGDKPFRIPGTPFDKNIGLHNFKPLESGKPVDPFERPVFSNPAPVGEKPKPAGPAEPGGSSSDDKR